MKRRWVNAVLALSPALIVFGAFFVVPFFILFQMSFYHHLTGLEIDRTFTLENYEYLFASAYAQVILNTFRISITSSLVGMILGYSVAYWLVRAKSKLKKFVLVIIVISFLISYSVRLYSWVLILSNYGTFNLILGLLGLGSRKFLYSEIAIDLGLSQFLAILSIFVMIGPIRNIDASIEEASRTLGASPARTFLSVTLPMSLPGLIATFSICFAWAVGAFATPAILGGGIMPMMSSLVYDKFETTLNFPLGSGIALSLTAICLLSAYGINKFLNRWVKWA